MRLVGDQVAVVLEGCEDGFLVGRVAAVGDGSRQAVGDDDILEEFIEMPPVGVRVRFRREILKHRIRLKDGTLILYPADITEIPNE